MSNLYEPKPKELFHDGGGEYNDEDFHFIWGLKSGDDLTGAPSNFYTMNDIELDYDDCKGEYLLSWESIYGFDSMQQNRAYFKTLLEAFENWCESIGIDIHRKPSFYVLPNYFGYSGFKTINEALDYFRCIVHGFCALTKEDEDERI